LTLKQHTIWNEDSGHRTIAPFTALEGGLLPALHAVQNEFGFVPAAAIAMLATTFNITRAEVFGVVTFYRDFRLDKPAGQHVLKLCRAEACQAVGGDELAQIVRKRLALNWGETSADGQWTLESVFCLGLCACGPSAMIDETLVARLDALKLHRLLDGQPQ
jgi:formate dehydrogenase subunit gamma